MTITSSQSSLWIRIGILGGAGLFVLGLVMSAAVVPGLRLLHGLQALIYVAVLLLARRRSAVGYGAGATVAVAWNSLNLFVTHLMGAGALELWSFLTTGHAQRVDTMAVFIAGVGHFLLLGACIAAMMALPPAHGKWPRFFAGGVAVLVYLGLIVAVAAPR
jgi:hypothetical protein